MVREVSVTAADEVKEGLMQRLSGLDSMFFYMDTPTNHMHMVGVFLLDPTVAPEGFSFAQVRPSWSRRLAVRRHFGVD